MPNQAVIPIIPNMSPQGEAVAGNSAAIFTATDRKIIEERGGEVNRNQSFIDLLKERPLTPDVENEETTVNPHQDVKELEGRYREHRQILKHSTVYTARDNVKITNQLPDSYKEPRQIVLETETQPSPKSTSGKEDKKVIEETAAMAKELKFNPAELFDKFALEQKKLFSLICRIKELHLKRLLTESEEEFEKLTEEIRKRTVSSAKASAKSWLEAQLDKLSRDAVEYKLNLLKSLQAMESNEQRKTNIKWLKKIIARLSKA